MDAAKHHFLDKTDPPQQIIIWFQIPVAPRLRNIDLD